MNSEDRKNLAKVRYERAEELLKSANTLLKEEDYKSANNRAFYCAEQAIKAVRLLIRMRISWNTGRSSVVLLHR